MMHLDPKAVAENANMLDEEHRSNNLLTETMGKVHEHLGMVLDFRSEGSYDFSQFDAFNFFGLVYQKYRADCAESFMLQKIYSRKMRMQRGWIMLRRRIVT